jgi:hypothetical protein
VAAPDEQPVSKPDDADSAVDRVIMAACGLAILFCLLNLVLFRYGRDQGIYAMVADTMLKGGAPYRDAWDFKPPGIFLVYAVARLLFGASEHGPRVLEAVGLASMVGAFAILSRRWVGDAKAGIVAATLAIGTEAQLEFWHTSQPESFGGVILAWALVCATYQPAPEARDGARKQLLAWACAGALYASAALLKPPLGGGFVVSLLAVAWTQWRASTADGRLRAVGRPLVAFAAGGAATMALTLSYFVAKGAMPELYDTLFVFTPQYTKLGFRGEWFWGFVYLAFEQWSIGYSAFIGVGLALFLALPALSDRERGGALHVFGIAGLQVVGVALQAKFFPYHYGAALPFASMLAGWGAWKLWKHARKTSLGIVLFGAALYVMGDARGATRDLDETFWMRSKHRLAALVDPSKRNETNDALYSVADVSAGANRRVAEWLMAHTDANAPVFIWGFEPEIYDLSRRRPATRYLYDVPQRVTWAESSRDRLMSDLERTPPAVIVVEHRDVFPAVTGNNLDSADSLSVFPRLASYLRQGYVLAERIEDFDLYVKR